jgi:chemotaxis signal transduction protein/nucleoid-associated protein YgaU
MIEEYPSAGTSRRNRGRPEDSMDGGRALLTITLGERRCGIWKDQVPAIAEVRETHRIPLSPSWVAGISVIADRTVTLADLSVCLCWPHVAEAEGTHALLMADKGMIPGFLVSGAIGECTVPPTAVLPIPGHLKTAVIDACAIEESVPIPIVDIAELYDRLLALQWKAPAPPAVLPEIPRTIAGETARVRMIALEGETFAAVAEKMWNDSVPLDKLVMLPSVPASIAGICFSRGSLLSVVALPLYLGCPDGAERTRLIVAQFGGSLSAFPVDSDLGDSDAKSLALKDLPPIFHLPWMHGAALGGHGISPVIDLAALASCRPEAVGDPPLPQRYSPDSRFRDLFGAQDLEVVEFFLLGTRCAIPRSEAKAVIPCRPFRRIPRTPEIVIGASELDGRLLPVLDLAAIFGRRSRLTPDWLMIRVSNGDFEALVACESVFGERRLERAIQREVPVAVPHGVFYGCYLDGNAVRLILNIEALTVHFERSLVKELEPALTSQMAMEVDRAPFLFEEKTAGTEADKAEAEIETEATAKMPAEHAQETPSPETTAGEEPAAEAAAVQAQEPAGIVEIEAEPGLTTTLSPEAIMPPIADELELSLETLVLPEMEIESAPITEAMAAPSFETEASQESAPPVEEPAAHAVLAAPVESAAAPSEAEPAAQSVAPAAPPAEPVVTHPAAASESAPAPGRREVRTSRRKLIALAAAILVLAAAISIFVFLVQKKPAALAVGPTAAGENPQPSLELDIPADSAVETQVYIVVEGDTLWSISERFTGNPYNYPRVAGENRIANPDLIFPGQRILLLKK